MPIPFSEAWDAQLSSSAVVVTARRRVPLALTAGECRDREHRAFCKRSAVLLSSVCVRLGPPCKRTRRPRTRPVFPLALVPGLHAGRS